MTEAAFWLCFAFVVYSYAGYPALLWVAGRLWGRPVRREPITPRVSFIIAARNEAARIGEKLENTLALRYPLDKLEVIVASDASDDGTDEIASRYAGRGVRLVRAEERRGKEHAQSLGIAASSGEVLIFSDAATRLEPDGVARIVENFADPEVGCVSSVDRVLGADGQPSNEGAYVRYEMMLRAFESKVGSVVGLSGSFFAARREVCTPWPADLPSDFNTVLNAIVRGMRGVSDPAAVGCYADLAHAGAEYARKVRTITRGLHGLLRNLGCLDPFRFGLTAWQLFSHKLCRWLVPFAMIGLLTTNVVLARSSSFYALLAVAQVAFYALAASAMATRCRFVGRLGFVPFFVVVNASILTAWWNLLRGRHAITWEPSVRPAEAAPSAPEPPRPGGSVGGGRRPSDV